MDLCTNLSNKVLDLENEVLDIKSTYAARIKKLESRVERLEEENRVLKELKGVHFIVDSDEPVMEKEKSFKHRRKITDIDANVEINLEKVQAEAYNLDLDHQEKVLSMLDVNDNEPANVEEVLEVVKAAKLITEVVTIAGVDVNAASVQDTLITAAKATKVIVPRKRRGVIIKDHQKATTTVTMKPKVQAKDKGKAILIEEPKPLKRQVKIKLDEGVARQLEAELNADINWNAMIDQVKRSEKTIDAVTKYQDIKRKPLIKAQARRNMIVYLQNMAGDKMNYFKEMSYDEIRPIFKKHYNYNQAFLNEVNEGIKVPEQEVWLEKEVEEESSKREGESIEQEITKKQKIKQETKELKKHLQIVPDDDDDDDDDVEDLESLWKIVRERFEKTEPKNYTNDFLLNTLIIMFEKHNVEANVWKDQKGKYGLTKMYPLTHFTLEQMINDVRLEVKDESEMSLELLRLVRRQLNEGVTWGVRGRIWHCSGVGACTGKGCGDDDIGTPCQETISLMYNLVRVFILSVAPVGMKCADLVWRSTMTQIVSCSFDVLGSFEMKSIVILSHFHKGIFGCTSDLHALRYYKRDENIIDKLYYKFIQIVPTFIKELIGKVYGLQVRLLELSRFEILLGELEDMRLSRVLLRSPRMIKVSPSIAHLVASITLESARSCVMQAVVGGGIMVVVVVESSSVVKLLFVIT
nr:hypothetical protein [Tanacetum cinerariifolium]